MFTPIIVIVEFVLNSAAVPIAKDLFARQIKYAKTEPGCLQYELYQDPGHLSRFLLIGRWKHKAYWEAHTETLQTKQFMAAIKLHLRESFKPSWYYQALVTEI